MQPGWCHIYIYIYHAINSLYKWWLLHGARTPELQRVAIAILSQVPTASACERNWSAYGHVHSKKRNRLTAERARKLVYVFMNMRALDKLKSLTDELRASYLALYEEAEALEGAESEEEGSDGSSAESSSEEEEEEGGDEAEDGVEQAAGEQDQEGSDGDEEESEEEE